MRRSWNKLYSFTTENIAGYLSQISSVGERALCVGGSGDHLLNAVLYGARKISVFDINPLSSSWIELKVAASKTLSFTEFKEFFLRSSPVALNYHCYKILAPLLSTQAQTFFDKSFSEHSYHGYSLRNSDVFNLSYDIDELKILSNTYLHDSSQYDLLQSTIAECTWEFTTCCITNLSQLFSKKIFDTIFLSNISDYLQEVFAPSTALHDYVRDIVPPLSRMLSPTGQLFAAYIYDVASVTPRTSIDNKHLRNTSFSNTALRYKEVTFTGVKENTLDAIIIVSSPTTYATPSPHPPCPPRYKNSLTLHTSKGAL